MLSDIWQEINFWNEYGEACSQTAQRWTDEALGDKKKVDEELQKVNRVVIEAGRDLSEDDWLDVAKKAKMLFGSESVLDIVIRKSLIGGGRVVVLGNIADNTVVNRYRKWRGYE